MDAYDEGSGARHGPAGPSGPDPRRALPGRPAAGAPYDAPGPGTPPGGAGAPQDGPPAPHFPASPSGAAPHAPGAPAGSPVPTGPPPDPGAPPPGTPAGVAALSLLPRTAAALALAVVAAVVCAHLAMTFLHVAPSNTVSKEHGEAIGDWIYPEFEQNWKLFAPNPLQQNIAVQVRAGIRTAGGGTRTTGWYDLSAQDGRAIDGNPLPSHTQQNELRRAWDFLVATHDDDNRPVGLRGALSEAYLRRIVVLRLDRMDAAGPGEVVERVQVRSRTTDVPPPKWSREQVSTTPVYRTLPWWPVPGDEARGGIG